jgi:hypothetical protein
VLSVLDALKEELGVCLSWLCFDVGAVVVKVLSDVFQVEYPGESIVLVEGIFADLCK